MKTAEEVARNIYTFVNQRAIDRDMETVVSHIAQALTAYAEERTNECLDESMRIADKSFVDIHNEARAEALEEAAKVAESFMGDRRYSADTAIMAEQIQADILALKEKP